MGNCIIYNKDITFLVEENKVITEELIVVHMGIRNI